MADYFTHDEDARNDQKLMKIRSIYGMEGYGCFFAILEMICSESSHSLNYNDEQFNAIAYDLHTNLDMNIFIDKCIDVGLFKSDGQKFWSEPFNKRTEEIDMKEQEISEKQSRRSESARKAVNARWAKKRAEQNQQQTTIFDEQKQEDKSTTEVIDLPEVGKTSFDSDWVRFVKCYEANIDINIPNPSSAIGIDIDSCFEVLGADIMCYAAEITNRKNPENKPAFMIRILKNWIKQGVNTIEKARMETQEHERRNKQWQSNNGSKPQPQAPIIAGKFY